MLETPTIRKPLIYNLFGSITSPESLILSYDDLFEYFKSVFGNNMLPKDVRSILKDADNVIFLGFQFDRWYVQLILNLLDIYDETSGFSRYALASSLSNDTRILCMNHFKIEFIGEDNSHFIDILYNKCQEEGMLRDLSGGAFADSNNEKVRELQEKIVREVELVNEYEKMNETEKKSFIVFQNKRKIQEIKEKIAEYETELESYIATEAQIPN
jgi:hypothetical protein